MKERLHRESYTLMSFYEGGLEPRVVKSPGRLKKRPI